MNEIRELSLRYKINIPLILLEDRAASHGKDEPSCVDYQLVRFSVNIVQRGFAVTRPVNVLPPSSERPCSPITLVALVPDCVAGLRSIVPPARSKRPSFVIAPVAALLPVESSPRL